MQDQYNIEVNNHSGGSAPCILVLNAPVDPCIGYVFHEPNPPHRKLVILGDTYDATPIIPIIQPSPTAPVSLVIHEATDTFISRHIDSSARRTKDEVESKVAARGHSTPV